MGDLVNFPSTVNPLDAISATSSEEGLLISGDRSALIGIAECIKGLCEPAHDGVVYIVKIFPEERDGVWGLSAELIEESVE